MFDIVATHVSFLQTFIAITNACSAEKWNVVFCLSVSRKEDKDALAVGEGNGDG